MSFRWRLRPSRLLCRSSGLRRTLVLAFAGCVIGCGTIEPVAPAGPPVTDPAQLYMSLTLDYPAINLSTDTSRAAYHTLQLAATPRDAAGNAMDGLPAPVFHSLDTTGVTVTADGLVRARQPGTGFKVIATLTAGLVTHDDTAYVNVTTMSPPPQLDTFSVQPGPMDSAIAPLAVSPLGGALYMLVGLLPGVSASRFLRATDPVGNAIDGLAVAYTSLDPLISPVDRRLGGLPKPLRPGRVRVVAQTMAYGIAKIDTVAITLTPPTLQDVKFQRDPDGTLRYVSGFEDPTQASASAAEVRIAPYGIVFWQNNKAFDGPVDIMFDDPTPMVPPPPALCDEFVQLFGGSADTYCGTGDVLMPGVAEGDDFGAALSIRMRQFPEPGVYQYHSIRAGISGRIVVTTE